MKIVVFDDNEKDLNKLVCTIQTWKQQHSYSDIVIFSYHDIDAFLFALPEINSYDAFFLDIMTNKDRSTGFRVAERIHHYNRRASIIFTTNSPEYFESAFEISAFRYMLKPINPRKIHAALDELYSKSRQKKNNAFIFQSDRQRIIIESDQILYIESITTDHRAKLILTDGSVTEISLSGTSFSNLIEEALSSDFCQCHRSYIVNLNYVLQYSNHIVVLQNHAEVPVSRKYKAELTNRMIEHYKKVY